LRTLHNTDLALPLIGTRPLCNNSSARGSLGSARGCAFRVSFECALFALFRPT
jgi:hypothetical protein